MEPNEPNQGVEPETTPESEPAWLWAVRAAEAKQASNITVLDLREVTSFTDQFVICTGSNPRQIQAIADEVRLQLKANGEMALNLEGYSGAEWILVDYADFIVHIFSEKARKYYDLERLWRHAKVLEIPKDTIAPKDTIVPKDDSAPEAP